MAVDSSMNVRLTGQEGISSIQPSNPLSRHRQGDVHNLDKGASREVEKENRQVEETRQGEQSELKAKDLDENELEQVREAINQTLQELDIKLQFTKAEDVDEMVVKVVSTSSEEVIRQIPPEAMLRLAKRMEDMTGLFISEWR